MWNQIITQYNSIWKMFLRPPRAIYYPFQLGDEEFSIGSSTVSRVDFELTNKSNETLQCSFYDISSIESSKQLPCVLFLHCNSGSRLDAKPLLDVLIPMGISLASFDFSGSGISQGELITLGFKEVEDVEVMMTFLKNIGRVDPKRIALWGRSMGAVTALRYVQVDRSVCCVISDSPFCSLKTLALEIARRKLKLPGFILKYLIKEADKQIKDKAGFKMRDLDITEVIEYCFTPIKFVVSINDDLVNYQHTERLFEGYPGKKEIMYVNGRHIDNRNVFELQEIADFIERYFEISNSKRNDNEEGNKAYLPPKIASKINIYKNGEMSNFLPNEQRLKSHCDMLTEIESQEKTNSFLAELCRPVQGPVTDKSSRINNKNETPKHTLLTCPATSREKITQEDIDSLKIDPPATRFYTLDNNQVNTPNSKARLTVEELTSKDFRSPEMTKKMAEGIRQDPKDSLSMEKRKSPKAVIDKNITSGYQISKDSSYAD